MTLSSTVYSLSKKAFDLIGDLKTPIVYTRSVVTGYNVTTDTETKTTTVLNIDVVIVNSEAREREAAPITFYDAKILVHADSMAGLYPIETDTIVMKGATYKVNQVRSPPTDPIFILMLVRI